MPSITPTLLSSLIYLTEYPIGGKVHCSFIPDTAQDRRRAAHRLMQVVIAGGIVMWRRPGHQPIVLGE